MGGECVDDNQRLANRNMSLNPAHSQAPDAEVRVQPRRVIEFFAGIGGFACAAQRVWGEDLDILAIDIDQTAQQIYQLNHSQRVLTREIQSLATHALAEIDAELWWLSPPCQPYSRRGHQRDTQDPRAQSLLHIIDQLDQVRPRSLALENVEGFAESRALELLMAALMRSGYHVQHRVLCPTEMGWPNRRRRFYLVASLIPLRAWRPLPCFHITVDDLIRGVAIDRSQCAVDDVLIERFSAGMDRVDHLQPECVTACFGSSYGKSLLHAGSYCMENGSLRRFAPAEVLRLLGFPSSFMLPPDLSYRRLWKLLGNSLAIPAVEYILAHLQFSPN